MSRCSEDSRIFVGDTKFLCWEQPMGQSIVFLIKIILTNNLSIKNFRFVHHFVFSKVKEHGDHNFKTSK